MIQVLSSLPKDIKPSDRVITLKPFQDDFIFSEARYPCLTSAWGTGKTMSVIEKIRLAAEEFPNNLIMVLRKEFVDLRDSTIKDWNEYTGITVGSNRDAVFPNETTVMFRHGGELLGNNLNNMNLGAFAIEQGEELDNDDVFFKLQGRLRRKGVRHFGAVIANTNGHNWIYKLWKANQGSDPDYKLFEATSFDNADILPEKTIEDWKKLEQRKPKVFRRFVMNSWDESDTTDVIIQPDWVKAAAERELIIRPPLRRIVSIDVARSNPGSGDKSVFYAIENFKQIGKEQHETRNTMELVGYAIRFAAKHGIRAFAVDEIGVGGGVADRLAELRDKEDDNKPTYQVIFVNAAERLTGTGYYNRRAQIHDYCAHLFEDGMVQIDPNDEDLKEQLSWAKYKTVKSNGVFLVEPKEDIVKKYKRSPDDADSFMNGVWALPQVREIIHGEDKYARAYNRSRVRRAPVFV